MAEQVTGDNIQQTLGLGRTRVARGRWAVGVVLALLLLLLLYAFFFTEDGAASPGYRATEVTRGDLTLTVTATGTLQPLNQVEVGSEVSGTIARVAVDFNDPVQIDQILAQLDTSTLVNRIVEGKASLQSAEARVREAEATELEKQAALKRCRELAKQRMCSDNDVDAAVAAYARARAGVMSAQAQVAIAEAVLSGYQSNLDKATIRSPINGIVLDRKVETGQTVAASFQTPVLFTLAEDLSRMELIVDIDEADIGRIRDGLEATFTVDAFPERTFSATITQVRHAPQTVEGVVSYETVLSVNNDELQLLPGMTATAEVITRQVHDALLIPNAALRYTPPVTQQSTQRSGSLLSQLFPRRRTERSTQPRAEPGMTRTIWLLQQGQPQALSIKLGDSDGMQTEVVAGELSPGMAVITETLQAGK
jgi:HlyD family secretion protein